VFDEKKTPSPLPAVGLSNGVKFEEILDGTSEIQRLNIAQKVLKL